MANSSSYLIDKKDLECPICFEDYNNSKHIPEVLLCLHTMCKICIKNLLNERNHLSCPLCRASQYVDLEDLMDNYFIGNYLRKKQEKEDLAVAQKLQVAFDGDLSNISSTDESPEFGDESPTSRNGDWSPAISDQLSDAVDVSSEDGSIFDPMELSIGSDIVRGTSGQSNFSSERTPIHINSTFDQSSENDSHNLDLSTETDIGLMSESNHSDRINEINCSQRSVELNNESGSNLNMSMESDMSFFSEHSNQSAGHFSTDRTNEDYEADDPSSEYSNNSDILIVESDTECEQSTQTSDATTDHINETIGSVDLTSSSSDSSLNILNESEAGSQSNESNDSTYLSFEDNSISE